MGLNHRTVESVFDMGLLVTIAFCVAAMAYSLHAHGMGSRLMTRIVRRHFQGESGAALGKVEDLQ